MYNVVAIGGGTGLSILLSELKKKFNVTAVVTVGDTGGGSGILRADLNMLPPGDIRNCLLALSEAPEDLQAFFSYRFQNGSLKGQSLGNLIIAGITEKRGSFQEGITLLSRVLKLKGKVLPVTLEPMNLVAFLENGNCIHGEAEIQEFLEAKNTHIQKLQLKENVSINKEIIDEIKKAKFVILGPGSLYTSVICNLLVDGMTDILQDKTIVYICNVMTQPGETTDYEVSKHVSEIEKYLQREVDYVLANTLEPFNAMLSPYKLEGSKPVIVTENDEILLKNKLITGDFIEERKGYLRSNAYNITERLYKLFND